MRILAYYLLLQYASKINHCCSLLNILDQRPWSEWKRTNTSCIQHTGHDVEQLEELYSLCEEPLINYCAHRDKLLAGSTSGVTTLGPTGAQPHHRVFQPHHPIKSLQLNHTTRPTNG